MTWLVLKKFQLNLISNYFSLGINWEGNMFIYASKIYKSLESKLLRNPGEKLKDFLIRIWDVVNSTSLNQMYNIPIKLDFEIKPIKLNLTFISKKCINCQGIPDKEIYCKKLCLSHTCNRCINVLNKIKCNKCKSDLLISSNINKVNSFLENKQPNNTKVVCNKIIDFYNFLKYNIKELPILSNLENTNIIIKSSQLELLFNNSMSYILTNKELVLFSKSILITLSDNNTFKIVLDLNDEVEILCSDLVTNKVIKAKKKLDISHYLDLLIKEIKHSKFKLF